MTNHDPHVDPEAYAALVTDVARILEPKLGKQVVLTPQENAKMDKARAKARKIVNHPDIKRLVTRPTATLHEGPRTRSPYEIGAEFPPDSAFLYPFSVERGGIQYPNGPVPKREPEPEDPTDEGGEKAEEPTEPKTLAEILAPIKEAFFKGMEDQRKRREEAITDPIVTRLHAQNELLKQRNAELRRGQGNWGQL